MVQVDGAKSSQSKPDDASENYLVGITAVLITCATAGFAGRFYYLLKICTNTIIFITANAAAGVYFEAMLKDGSNTSFWIRNLQMYSSGVVMALLSCLPAEGASIAERGFFHGYTRAVVCIVG